MIDSWAWIEYFRGTRYGARAKPFIEGDEPAVVSAINVCEVYRRFHQDYNEATAEDYRNVMRLRATVIPVDEAIAVAAAKAKVAFGWGLGDCLVYATSRAADARIVSGDPDFQDVKDVAYIGPERPVKGR